MNQESAVYIDVDNYSGTSGLPPAHDKGKLTQPAHASTQVGKYTAAHLKKHG